ncbi:MAG TPA: acetyl/propionyl/methylcrotonyl-CoA carboxylase subunit alpha [Devosia sp.]|nr:acetyl/propionyl/methylcrotonyl-CoA carboxylase subunit alpha [Devosia sp.]
MFTSLLIANRGEIACRVIKTAKRMGLRTIAVYSDADRDALHVKLADEAVHIGGSAARDSYLSIDSIVAACKATGAEAVHPGYGFLSENPAFAAALDKNGIIFVGPPAKAIAAMGDKIESKKLAAAAGVSTVPGHMGVVADAAEAVKIAKRIGYPVMIKASAGGGGKGMRIAWNDFEAREGFDRSRSEAASSFGDDRIFIEKFVTEPRHIEIQLIGDKQGNVLWLNERECSIQRRNQKVIEEAPSPFLDGKTRKAMGEQAVALAKAVGYYSAGTVEFIVDKDRNFYFLEMNTRLQVEHPVTELTTGLDLVELMLRVAAGEKLPLSQKDVKLNGWAVEARLYAEDPYRNFLPSTGRLTRYSPPRELQSPPHSYGVRNDAGVYEGGDISTYYDPMISKLCTWAPTREAAIDAMQMALDQFEVEGVGNNIPFLSAVMAQPRFREGRLSTGYIAEEFPDGFSGVTPDDVTLRRLAALACCSAHALEARGFADVPPLPNGHETRRAVLMAGRRWDFSVHADGIEYWLTESDGKKLLVETGWKPGMTLASARLDGELHHVRLDRITGGFRLRWRGADLVARVLLPAVADLMPLMPVKTPPDLSRFLLCPMPGQVVRIDVKAGDIVESGQPLAIVEAMKMENVLKAERRARVSKVRVTAGAVLAVDEVILEFEAV